MQNIRKQTSHSRQHRLSAGTIRTRAEYGVEFVFGLVHPQSQRLENRGLIFSARRKSAPHVTWVISTAFFRQPRSTSVAAWSG